ncbi:hypothetical protein [Flavobacterium sp.]|jgi:hypothetical protein
MYLELAALLVFVVAVVLFLRNRNSNATRGGTRPGVGDDNTPQ